MKPGQPCLATTARCDAACSTGLVDVPAPRQRATARSRLQRLADPALALCSTATAGGPNGWHLVDLLPQLVGDLRLLGLQHLAHHGHDVLATCWLGICGVQVVERHILQQNWESCSTYVPRRCCYGQAAGDICWQPRIAPAACSRTSHKGTMHRGRQRASITWAPARWPSSCARRPWAAAHTPPPPGRTRWRTRRSARPASPHLHSMGHQSLAAVQTCSRSCSCCSHARICWLDE